LTTEDTIDLDQFDFKVAFLASGEKDGIKQYYNDPSKVEWEVQIYRGNQTSTEMESLETVVGTH
jgi:hypothetical protein